MGLNAVILRNLSDRFLLAYDNDSAGKEGMKKDRGILSKTGAFVTTLELDKGFKDCAEYLESPDKLEILGQRLKLNLKKLYEI